uniref:Glycosyltransferase n=1 Tax=Strongyloides papillosus TaxID=174720 RepID=A0A0N5BNJ0_STREA
MKFVLRFLISCFVLLIFLSFRYRLSKLLNYYFSLLKTPDKIKAKEIAVVAVNLDDKLDGYIHAIRTMRCYCLYYGYTYIILNELTNQDLAKNCKQDDFMFRRHCIVSNFGLKYQKEIKYILFIDGDVGVVNPLKRIENYLPRDNEEILLYDRLYNDEIAAGSYIIKNDNYSRNFLYHFANYSFRVPLTNDGTDNVALQPALLDYLGINEKSKEYRHCMGLYEKAYGFDSNMIVVSCFRYILEKHNETPNDRDYHTYGNGKIKIIKKLTTKKWVRDTWLADWTFCDEDFLHHGWKTSEINESNIDFLKKFNPTTSSCKNNDFLKKWFFNESKYTHCNAVKKVIDTWMIYANEMNQKNLDSSNVTNLSHPPN